MPTETAMDGAPGEHGASDPTVIERRKVRAKPGDELLVFGYGSLMWNPDFPYLDVLPAALYGYHRAFCVTSTHYRGTEERPGLVLGLDRGGMCFGRMFRVKPEHADKVIDYLHGREMINGVYEPKLLKLRLEHGRHARALAYVADRAHRDYAGKLAVAEVANRIRGAVGKRGSNVEYLKNTVRHLEEMGIHECSLHQVLRQVEGKQ
jgi:cation transport protein ChaC